MCYVKELLAPGEEVTYEADTSFWPLALAWITAAVMLPVLLVAAAKLPPDGERVAQVAATLFFVPLLWKTVAWYRAELVVTDRRVLGTTGLVRRRPLEATLADGTAAAVRQGWLGRWFDFGSLSVAGRTLHGIDDPARARRDLVRAIQLTGQCNLVQGPCEQR